MIIKKEAAFLRQPHFNLNLIVDRPDGLIKERKKILLPELFNELWKE